MKILLPVMDLNIAYKTPKTSKITRNSGFPKNLENLFSVISPILVRHTPRSLSYLLFYYTSIDHNNLSLPSHVLHTKTHSRQTSWHSYLTMTSLPPTQSPNPVPAAAVPKPDPDEPPTPWLEVVAMFKTTSTPKPATPIVPIAPLIVANTTLEQDKETVLRCWLAMGGEEDVLRRRYYDGGWKRRDEPSDDVSEWCGVVVEGGRVTKLNWVTRA